MAAGYSRSIGYVLSIIRYNIDGSVDSTFGVNGIVTNQIGTDYLEGNTILIQSDGKIIAAGYATFSLTNEDFAVVRYNQDGSLDSTFDTNGFVNTDFGGSKRCCKYCFLTKRW